MVVPSPALSQSQAKRLDLARRRRLEDHASVEDGWVRTIADLVASGVSVRAIATHLAVSRQTVYDWLDKADQSR
jgi:transposase-like protein